MSLSLSRIATAVCAAVLTIATAQADTLRWARGDDGTTVDPHSVHAGINHAFNQQIYEALVWRDYDGGLQPLLATSWKLTDDPSVWSFSIRPGVTFHDGAVLTADDVVFSLQRARAPTSGMKGLLTTVSDVVKVDDHTVHIHTKGPDPLLPGSLTSVQVLSADWARKHGVELPQDLSANEEKYTTLHTNGTGPYFLVSREPNVRSVLRRHEGYWGKDIYPVQVSEIEMTPIKSAATRIAALLSGQVDFVQDVPPQDIERLRSSGKLEVRTRPQNRTAFLGLNVGAAELTSSNVKGKNPLADKRVRHALNVAIDRQAIQRVVLRGQSTPTGTIAPPFVYGYDKDYAKPPVADTAAAKKLLAEAGYPDGFSVTLDCANTFEAVCQSLVGMFGRVGVKVNLESRAPAAHSAQVTKGNTDLYYQTWGVPSFDSAYIFNFLVHTRNDSLGSWNGTGYSNPELDRAIVALGSETDVAKRDAGIAAIWKTVQDEAIYLPLHDMVQAYAMNPRFDIAVPPSSTFYAKTIRVNKP